MVVGSGEILNFCKGAIFTKW